jgi:hypothetical protein
MTVSCTNPRDFPSSLHSYSKWAELSQSTRNEILQKATEQIVMKLHFHTISIPVLWLWCPNFEWRLPREHERNYRRATLAFFVESVLYRGIWIRSFLGGLIHSLVLVLMLRALAWARVERYLLDIQHSRSDGLACLESQIFWNIF